MLLKKEGRNLAIFLAYIILRGRKAPQTAPFQKLIGVQPVVKTNSRGNCFWTDYHPTPTSSYTSIHKPPRMQFYHAAAPPPLTASGPNRHPEYPLYPQATTSPRMNWNPAAAAAMHQGHWGGYDFSHHYGFNPAAAALDPTRSPPYHGAHVTSPDAASGSAAATPHNIRDILGAQQQASLQSEIAKTPSSYQQSPTCTSANVFSPPCYSFSSHAQHAFLGGCGGSSVFLPACYAP